MENVEELKQQRDSLQRKWLKIYLGAFIAIVVLEKFFDQQWAMLAIFPFLFVLSVFVRIRMAAKVGDQYEIYSQYRLLAISFGLSYAVLLAIHGLNKAFGAIRIDPENVLIFAPLFFLILISLYDRYIARGDAE